jgi:hypothetical protein
MIFHELTTGKAEDGAGMGVILSHFAAEIGSVLLWLWDLAKEWQPGNKKISLTA